MSLNTVTLNTTPGRYWVTFPGFAYVYVVAVFREGKANALINDLPTGTTLRCRHRGGRFSEIRFSADRPFTLGEQLFVIYKSL